MSKKLSATSLTTCNNVPIHKIQNEMGGQRKGKNYEEESREYFSSDGDLCKHFRIPRQTQQWNFKFPKSLFLW